MLELLHSSRADLLRYLVRQLDHFFPDQASGVEAVLDAHLDVALHRLERCINQVRMWKPGQFDALHSSQYTIFVYYLANTLWRSGGRTDSDLRVCTKLFLLNKALNGIDCFYEIELPEVFFIGHSVGIVLAKATYGERLVIYQNSTVGKNHGCAPVLEAGVVMYPNTAVIGRCLVREGSVISQGVSVVNQDTPPRKLVFQGERGSLVFKASERDILGDIFRA
jgi:serine O-acetyltransferase